MAHDHIIYDSDPHFSIDVDTRAISYDSPSKLVLVQGDHNSEIFTFDMPRFADGHDMLECDIKQIHYINLDSERSILKSSGVYTIEDMKQSDEDENKLVFSWTVSKKATKYVGSLSFAIRFACSGEEESTLDYDWKTLPYASVPVSKTIDSTEDFVEDNYDALQEWYNTLLLSGKESVNLINDARNQAIEDVQNEASKFGGFIVSNNEPTTENGVAWLNAETGVLRVKNASGEFKPLESIRGEPGGLSNITQEFGSDEELVISQKVITDKIQELENKDAEFQFRFDSDSSSWVDVGNRLDELENARTELQEKDTEHDSKISDLETNLSSATNSLNGILSSDIPGLNREQATMKSQIEALETKDSEHDTAISALKRENATIVMCRSGSYSGTGDASSGNPIYFTSEFEPQMVIVKDSSAVMPDLIITRNYINPLYESNSYIVKPIDGNTTQVVTCIFDETAHGVHRLTISAISGTASDANHIYNGSGRAYFWFAIGTKPES